MHCQEKKKLKIRSEVNSMADISKLPINEQKVIQARREYFRKWRQANKDKVREHNRRYWQKKAIENGNNES